MSHTKGRMIVDCRLGCVAIYPETEKHDCLSGIDKTAIFYQSGRGYPSHGIGSWRFLTDEQEANATFIADAFNVTHETGLTPRELADVLKKMIVEYEQGHGVEELIWFAQERIAKAEGGAE
jgi:hypothetical protein